MRYFKYIALLTLLQLFHLSIFEYFHIQTCICTSRHFVPNFHSSDRIMTGILPKNATLPSNEWTSDACLGRCPRNNSGAIQFTGPDIREAYGESRWGRFGQELLWFSGDMARTHVFFNLEVFAHLFYLFFCLELPRRIFRWCCASSYKWRTSLPPLPRPKHSAWLELRVPAGKPNPNTGGQRSLKWTASRIYDHIPMNY